MRFITSLLAVLVFAVAASPQDKFTKAPPIHDFKDVSVPNFSKDHLKFPRGMKPTPRAKIFAAPRFVLPSIAAPSQVLMLPKQLSMWGNSQYGDCVSASEAASKACYSVYCGLPETFITEATVIAWARKYGYLNGAMLDEVMQTMQTHGMTATDSKVYTDGPYTAVDYSNESVLQAAIALGPVNTGIDADALPSSAGNSNAWYAFGGTPGRFSNEDHCVPLVGYGQTVVLFAKLSEVYGVSVTPPVNAPKNGYLLFTWSTIGVVDHAWIMSTMGESWVRNPTTPGQSPQPGPTPDPPPGPTPIGTKQMTLRGFGAADGTFDVVKAGTMAKVSDLLQEISGGTIAKPVIEEKPRPPVLPAPPLPPEKKQSRKEAKEQWWTEQITNVRLPEEWTQEQRIDWWKAELEVFEKRMDSLYGNRLDKLERRIDSFGNKLDAIASGIPASQIPRRVDPLVQAAPVQFMAPITQGNCASGQCDAGRVGLFGRRR